MMGGCWQGGEEEFCFCGELFALRAKGEGSSVVICGFVVASGIKSIRSGFFCVALACSEVNEEVLVGKRNGKMSITLKEKK
jgi:hypothetical protein